MLDIILQEIERGELVRETLAEDAVSFTGEHEAMYFSNLRRNLKSDLAALVINMGQCLDDLVLLQRMGIVLSDERT